MYDKTFVYKLKPNSKLHKLAMSKTSPLWLTPAGEVLNERDAAGQMELLTPENSDDVIPTTFDDPEFQRQVAQSTLSLTPVNELQQIIYNRIEAELKEPEDGCRAYTAYVLASLFWEVL